MPRLASKEYCTGCTACASACPKACIAMTEDKNGFLYPIINADACIACGLCEKACPVMTPLKTGENEPKAYAANSTDEKMRLVSSSGGVFTEIAKAILAHGGAVFGAAYGERYEVVHIRVETEEDLAKLRGAKYAQSDLRGVFADVKDCLKQGRKVLFSGTPCQVGGLKAYLGEDNGNLLTVDFVCHSVPSPMAWHEYVKYRAEQDNGGELPASINLRSKVTGWSRFQYSNLFVYANDDNHIAKSDESLYMKLFVGGYISRESCASCKFKGYNRVSDLTIGDFWGIWDIIPEMDDNKGTSVVFVQSKRGGEFLTQITQNIILRPVTLEEATRHNQAMLKCARPNEKRNESLDMIGDGKIAKCEKWFFQSRKTATQKINGLLKALHRR